MFMIVAPIFMVILLGYLFGRLKPDSGNADKLINDYVLYVALPALLFSAIAKADISQLKQWGFIVSTLLGIVAVYIIAGVIAKLMKIPLPQSSLLSMGACFGTTGFMGVPILLTIYGEQAALPAAIATILHNIPAMMAVIISWDMLAKNGQNTKHSVLNSIYKAVKITFTNPLTVAVLAGLLLVIFEISVPPVITAFTTFLGNATGPTALFALGLGLSRLKIQEHFKLESFCIVTPMVVLKLILQPVITFAIAYYVFDMRLTNDIWLIAAIVMAAQPIGAGVYVFAKKYGYQPDTISLAIIISLLIALITIPVTLSLFTY